MKSEGGSVRTRTGSDSDEVYDSEQRRGQDGVGVGRQGDAQ